MYTMDAGYTRTALLFSTVSGNGPVVLPDIVDKVKCLNGYEIFFGWSNCKVHRTDCCIQNKLHGIGQEVNKIKWTGITARVAYSQVFYKRQKEPIIKCSLLYLKDIRWRQIWI